MTSSQTVLIHSKATSRLLVLLISVAVAVLVVQAFVGTPSARALDTITDRPDGGTWNTNGTVFASALSEDGRILYIGGKFTTVRQNPPPDAGDKILVSNVAAIDVATGAAVDTWTPQVTGDGAVVRSLTVQGDRVFIGGNFTAVGEDAQAPAQPRQHLAAVDAADGSVDPFAPNVSKGSKSPFVFALLAGDSKLYVGGQFSHVNGKSRANLAAFDLGTGELDSVWRPKTTGKVQDLEFGDDDGGDTGDDGDSIFAAGQFGNITGSNGTKDARQSLARVYTDTGHLHPWEIPACPSSGCIQGPQQGWDITVTSTMVYGGFGAGPNFAAAFRISSDPLLNGKQAWRWNTVGNVQTVALSPDGSRLFLGGHFGTNSLNQSVCGGKDNLSGLASVNPLNGSIINCDWLPYVEPSDGNGYGPWTMTVTDTQLWVGGGFTHISKIDQRNIARFTL